MIAFGLVSFVLSCTLAVVAYSLVRTSLISDRKDAALRQAYTNAATATTPALVVGVPIRALDAAYYEVTSLDDMNHTLSVLASSLLLAAVAAAVVGALTGAFLSRSPVAVPRGDGTSTSDPVPRSDYENLIQATRAGPSGSPR